MAEVLVTETLIDTIKKYRKKINLRGDVLSKKLKKNTSFISQIETGKMEYIDTDVLYRIFNFIFEEGNETEKKIDSIIGQLQLSLSDAELKRQEWMAIMDLQYRLIPIPIEVVNFIDESLKKINKTSIEIINQINKNEPLYEDYDDQEIMDMEVNKVYYNMTNDSRRLSIRFSLSNSFIEDILTKKTKRCNFVNMQIIVMTLLKFLEEKTYNETYDEAKNILFRMKFYTLLEKQYYMKTGESQTLLAPYDIDFQNKMDTINDLLNEINDRQPGFLNDILDTFIENIKSEPILTFSIISKKLSGLNSISRENKKQLIDDYKGLLAEYLNKLDDVEKIEAF